MVRRIADTLILLQQHGNGLYIGWELQFHSSLSHIVEDLQKIACTMEADLEKCNEEIEYHRDNYYELNYFTTQQLLQLREELGRFKNPEMTKLSPVTLSLLQSVSRQVNSEMVKETIDITLTHWQEEGTPSKKAQVLEFHNLSHSASASNQHLGHDLRNTSSIMDDILATEGNKSNAPIPLLTENTLSESLKSMLITVKKIYEYSESLILLAFERCDDPNDMDEVVAWCSDNLENYDYNDKEKNTWEAEEENELSFESSEDEQESVENDKDLVHIEDNIIEEEVQSQYGFHLSSKLTMKDRLPVDENHPIVKHLLDLEYSLNDSLMAVHEHPDDSEAALSYLDQSGYQGQLFGNILEAEELIESQKGFLLKDSDDNDSQSSSESLEERYVLLIRINNVVISMFHACMHACMHCSTCCSNGGDIKIWKNPAKIYLSLLELGELLRIMTNKFPR